MAPPARRHSFVLTGALLVFTAPLAACALATFNGEEYATTCGFSGRTDHACGQCIAANCQAPVDACCANETCRKMPDDSAFGVSSSYGDPGALKRLDTCAQGGSCQALEADPRAKDIAACIQTSCQGSCDLWRKSTLRPEESSCEVKAGTSYSPPSCECTIPATTEGAPTSPNSVRCSTKTIPSSVCCASDDWPAPASTCRCVTVSCLTAGDQCYCKVASSTSEGVNACARGTCCISAYDGSCTRGSSCGSDDTIVDQCNAESVVCGRGRRTVASCSAK